MKVNIAISNHHVHLSQEDLDTLFATELVMDRALTQEDEYASTSYVTIKGPKGSIEHVRVLGPVRDYTQVEVSRTDAYKLGINPPIRNSGDLEGSSPITIIGPKGEVNKEFGCILATRHIHMNQSTADSLGFKNNQELSVHVGGPKGGTFEHVLVKVTPKGVLEMQVDTDDGNGFMIGKDSIGEIL